MWIHTATSTSLASRDGSSARVKLYGAYDFKFGTQIGAFFYAASGTPITTYVNTTNQIPVMVNGRGDMGRTPFLNRTDLLLTHELGLAGTKRLRLEMNVLNVFNQKTARHIFNSLNKVRARRVRRRRSTSRTPTWPGATTTTR
jgi:hypothetical protein